MNKNNEKVWVFPSCMLPKIGEFPGVDRTEEARKSFMEEVLLTCKFLRRGDVEDKPLLQQVIPYQMVFCGGKILVYNRGGKGGEKRLADKWSIGVGGHINESDVSQHEELDPQQILLRSGSRELHEELSAGGVALSYSEREYFGLLKADDTDVDKVHFGVVYVVQLSPATKIEESEEITRHKFVTFKDLDSYELETWSSMAYEALLNEEVQRA